MINHWIGVASRDHVLGGVAGGFAQLGHGKGAPLERLKPGDRLVYYSPRETLEEGAPPVQAFTAIGAVLDSPVRRAEGEGFKPFRRDVRFFQGREAPIRPLLERLSFTRGKRSWGIAFRRGLFSIPAEDYAVIAAAMGAEGEAAGAD